MTTQVLLKLPKAKINPREAQKAADGPRLHGYDL